MSRPPKISVVIPTHERETRLSFALEALARQTLGRDEFEVVVVRSADAKGPFAPAPPGLEVRFLTHEGPRGPGAQRNTGWSAARGPLVAFTDDDCRPDPGWLAALLAAAAPETVVQGRTEPDPDEAHLLLGLSRSVHVNRLNGWYATCNIAYPAELLRRLGGFDESFRFSAEDADLGLRARKAGARAVFESGALVVHAVLPAPLPVALADAWRRDSTPMLLARHPEHRRALVAGLFWKRTHAALLLAAFGSLLARRRPVLAALAWAPYLDCYVDWRLLRRPRGLARVLLNLGGRLLVDGAEVAVTLRGAVRHRTPIA